MTRPRASARSRLRIVSGAGALGLLVMASLGLARGAPAWVGQTVAVAARSTVAVAVASLVASTDPGPAAPSPRLRAAPTPPAASPPNGGSSPTARGLPRPAHTTPVGLGRSTPERLRIDAIGVDTDLVGLGLEDDGSLQVPAGAFPAGWYRDAPTPGELGPAVIVGHVDWAGASGVFADLGVLRAGDEVAVTREDGSTAVFVISAVRRVPKHDFPTMAVYGDLDHAGLRLITCGGAFDDEAASYEDNVIVFAELDRVIRNAGEGRHSSSVGAPPS